MKKNIMLISLFFVFSSSAFSDCNMKKAAINKVAESKIGISGNCDAKLAIETKTEKSEKAIKTAKKIKEHRDEDKENNKTGMRDKFKNHVDSQLEK